MVREFANLYDAIDSTTSTNAKVAAMATYFAAAPAADAAWAVLFLTGRRLKRLVPHASIGEWTLAATGLEDWMLGECYSVVGGGAETAALLLDAFPTAVKGWTTRGEGAQPLGPAGINDATLRLAA